MSSPSGETHSFFNRAQRRRTSITFWTFCLTTKSKSKDSSRRIVNVNPRIQTVCDLYEMAAEIFKESGTVQSLSAGFPPKVLELDSNSLLSESGLSDKERIQVTLGDPPANDQQQRDNRRKNIPNKRRGVSSMAEAAAIVAAGDSRKGKKRKTTKSATDLASDDDESYDIDLQYEYPSDDSDCEDSKAEDHKVDDDDKNDGTGPRRSKRAAAQAATESFGAVIEEQERLLREASEQRQKKKQKQSRRGHVASATASSRDISKTSSSKTVKIAGEGRRLGDGAVVQTPVSPSNKRKQSSSKSSLLAGNRKNKNEDMSVALLGALNDSGTMGRILRKGLSNAVQNSFETNKAVTRISAVIAYTTNHSSGGGVDENQKLKIEKSNGDNSDDNRLLVKFAKGVQGRGFYEETVDYIPKDVLMQVIQGIYKTNQEALRPQNIAFLSPRVLWSLVYHFCYDFRGSVDNNDRQQQLSMTVEEAMQNLLPNLDWAFLKRRKHSLSEKAMENLRQEQMEKGEEQNENWDKAAEAIQDVENAMENLQSFDRSQRSKRMAKAAIERQRQRQQQEQREQPTPWNIVTPTDSDEDELLECIATAPPQASSENSTSDENLLSIVVRALMEELKIHNWRELANVMDSSTSTTASTTFDDVAKNCNKALIQHGGVTITTEQVEQWADYAQQQSVDEIMIEICDDNIVAVELLRENARSGTPKDLVMWKNIPDELFQECTKQQKATDASPFSRQLIETWCHRADSVLKQFEWLNWYATPVE